MKKTDSHFPKYAIGFAVGLVAAPILKSGVAKKLYTYITAGGFIAKNGIMSAVENIQTSAMDISDDAKGITERYYAKQAVVFEDDETEEAAEAEEEA